MMFGFLRALIASKSILGLEINGRFVRAVQVVKGSGGLEIEKAAVREVPDPERIAETLEEFVRTEKLRAEILITALPTSSAFIREIDLPFASPKKLRQIIKFQLEPLVPYPVEEIVADFLPPMKGEPITAVGIEKRLLLDHLQTMDRAELHPDRVSLQDLALCSLFLAQAGKGQPTAVVRMDETETAVQVIRGRRMDFLRLLPGAREHLDLLRSTFSLYSLKEPESRPVEVFVTGPLAAEEGMTEKVEAAVGIKTSLWRPFDGMQHKLGPITDDTQGRLAVALGLAVGAEKESEGGLDLLQEEFAPRTVGDLKAPLITLFCALILLAGLWTFQLYHKLHMERIRYGALNAEIAQVFNSTFPEASHRVKGMELEQMRQRIAEERGKYQWLPRVMAQGPVLETLLNLTRAVSGFSDVKVENISVEDDSVHLDGSASTFKTVDSLKGKLTGTESFRDVKLLGAKMDNRDKVVKFSFVMEKKP